MSGFPDELSDVGRGIFDPRPVPNNFNSIFECIANNEDVEICEITGLIGLAIIDTICKGESNPEKLASLRHGNCRKSEKEIAKALQSNGRKDLLFALTHEYQLYQLFHRKITECDKQIKQLLNEQINNDENKSSISLRRKSINGSIKIHQTSMLTCFLTNTSKG